MTFESSELQTPELTADWGVEFEALVCERCDWSYLLPRGSVPAGTLPRCPHCFQQNLSPIETGLQELPYTRPPEMYLPYMVSAARLEAGIRDFAKGIPFAPTDLSAQSLQSRLRRVWVPMWLVDAGVRGTWEAEAGFNYQVVSHQEFYDQNKGGWSTREVTEGRVRWEPRLGRLDRTYQNITAPALEDDARLAGAVGPYAVREGQPFSPQVLQNAYVRLPNRPPADSWSDALPALQNAAADECRQAAGADHIRQFKWQPEFQDQNWTLLLLPLHTTFYYDDENQPQQVLVHGQTGKVSGERRASMKRAQSTALVILAVAAGLFILSLLVTLAGIVTAVLLPLGIAGLVLALVVALGAAVPPFIAWRFNKTTTDKNDMSVA